VYTQSWHAYWHVQSTAACQKQGHRFIRSHAYVEAQGVASMLLLLLSGDKLSKGAKGWAETCAAHFTSDCRLSWLMQFELVSKTLVAVFGCTTELE